MLAINKLKRKAKDPEAVTKEYEIAAKCNIICLFCPTYTTVKDFAKCEVREARGRIFNRMCQKD